VGQEIAKLFVSDHAQRTWFFRLE